MRDHIMLDFPVLTAGGGDFSDGVSYQVEATEEAGHLLITHKLTGESFIRELIEADQAKFSVLLVYKNSAERKHYMQTPQNMEGGEITATQRLHKHFSYAPEVMPSIVLLTAKTISGENALGVSKTWQSGSFNIPQYARIARSGKLRFTSGSSLSLFEVKHNKDLVDGQMQVSVNPTANEGVSPVILYCAKDVCDVMRNMKNISKANNSLEAMQLAVITHALSCVYAEMQMRHQKLGDDEQQIGGVLAVHMGLMQDTIDESWQDDAFSPSLAATIMAPYCMNAIHRGDDND